MNYMTEVAKMLGVELGEHFECNDHGKWFNLDYWFTDKALMCNGVPAADSLMMFLSGELTIKSIPWKPKYGESYYYIDENGDSWENTWNDDYLSDHANYYKFGNCYKTKEEAISNRDKWIAFYASDDVLEV